MRALAASPVAQVSSAPASSLTSATAVFGKGLEKVFRKWHHIDVIGDHHAGALVVDELVTEASETSFALSGKCSQ